jgi:hypothetical protein
VKTPKKDHVAKDEAPAKNETPAKIHLASPTPEGVINLYEALTGKTCTAEEIAEIHAEFARLPK